jgi:uncharacterized protein (TIGR03067 family)
MKHLLFAFVTVWFAPLALAEDQDAPAKPANTTPSTDKAGETKPEVYAQDGVWKPIAAVLGGVRLPEAAVKAITLKVAHGKYEVTVEGELEPDKGTCIIDTSATPKRMTIKSTDGPNRGKTFLAIFEMKDAVSMRVCYDLSGQEFPKEFKAPKGTQLYLVGYRRQKEQPEEKAAPQ